MRFRGYKAFFTWIVLIVGVVISVVVGGVRQSRANESTPDLKFEWIDDDGTSVPADWQSATAWTWNDQKLVLQIWFEVPSHLTPTLPAQLTKKIASPQTKAPFKISPDHVLIVMQLQQPVELFRFEDGRNRFLKISTQSTKTNWMRNASCKDASPYLEEVQNSGVGPFFISLTCRGRAGDDTAWIDIATSSEVNVEIEPLGKTKHKGHSILMTMPAAGAKANERKLAILRFRDTNGDISAVYTLSANPPQTVTPAPEPSVQELPIAAPAPVVKPAPQLLFARMGLHAQFVRSGEANDGENRRGRSSAEVALSGQAEFRRVSFNLELPVRRMGTGLDAGSPGDTLSWGYLGFKLRPDETPDERRTRVSLGVQASLLDSRLEPTNAQSSGRERVSTVSISPAAEWTIDRNYSLTLAPIDVRSQLSFIRGRALFPLAKESRYALALEAFGARSFGKGHEGWYTSGLTLGFTGGF